MRTRPTKERRLRERGPFELLTLAVREPAPDAGAEKRKPPSPSARSSPRSDAATDVEGVREERPLRAFDSAASVDARSLGTQPPPGPSVDVTRATAEPALLPLRPTVEEAAPPAPSALSFPLMIETAAGAVTSCACTSGRSGTRKEASTTGTAGGDSGAVAHAEPLRYADGSGAADDSSGSPTSAPSSICRMSAKIRNRRAAVTAVTAALRIRERGGFPPCPSRELEFPTSEESIPKPAKDDTRPYRIEGTPSKAATGRSVEADRQPGADVTPLATGGATADTAPASDETRDTDEARPDSRVPPSNDDERPRSPSSSPPPTTPTPALDMLAESRRPSPIPPSTEAADAGSENHRCCRAA